MSTGNYRANPQRARMVAEKLRSLAERPQQIQDEMAGHFAYYDRWKGRPDAVADSFYRDAKKTEDEWKESLLEQTGLQGATFGVVAATLTVANSAEGTERGSPTTSFRTPGSSPKRLSRTSTRMTPATWTAAPENLVAAGTRWVISTRVLPGRRRSAG
ncbi:hypothetical protein IHE61_27255 [Streptomyces sp. GKU 257-1]|nr:hypothetical protein [Streptomyces sp. GKU 257-1]